MVPTWTGKLEKMGKRYFYPKYWKSEGILSKILEKSEGILATFYFYFFSDF